MKAPLLIAITLLIALSLAVVACDDEGEDVPDDAATPTAVSSLITPHPSSSSADPPSATVIHTAAPPKATPALPPPGWESLANTAYGYSLSYPGDWFLVTAPEEPDPNMTTDDLVYIYSFPPPSTGHGGGLPPDKLKLEIVVLDNADGQPLEDWVDSYHSNPTCPTEVKTRSSDLLNGIAVVEDLVSFSCAEGVDFRLWFFGFGSRVVLVNGVRADSELISDVVRIIESLRFQ